MFEDVGTDQATYRRRICRQEGGYDECGQLAPEKYLDLDFGHCYAGQHAADSNDIRLVSRTQVQSKETSQPSFQHGHVGARIDQGINDDFTACQRSADADRYRRFSIVAAFVGEIHGLADELHALIFPGQNAVN